MSDSNDDIGFKYYRYNPSLAAAAVFVFLFVVSTLFHIYQLIRFRTWYFIPFVIGGMLEAIGYGGRIGSALETPAWKLVPYIVQTLLILISPSLFAASVYMILGRIIRLVDGEKHSVIPARWLTKVFVTTDVISFLMQGAGGSMLAKATNKASLQTGQNVIIGGLVVQLVGFGVFVIVSVIFHRRITQRPTSASATSLVPWRWCMYILNAVSGLILVRSLFRIVEYGQGWDGSIQSYESLLYIFDAALMFIVMVLLNVWHPSRIISGPYTKGVDAESRLGFQMGTHQTA